jgi:hypothetical protein
MRTLQQRVAERAGDERRDRGPIALVSLAYHLQPPPQLDRIRRVATRLAIGRTSRAGSTAVWASARNRRSRMRRIHRVGEIEVLDAVLELHPVRGVLTLLLQGRDDALEGEVGALHDTRRIAGRRICPFEPRDHRGARPRQAVAGFVQRRIERQRALEVGARFLVLPSASLASPRPNSANG